jgi:YVTN family beta-propeller protein
MRFASALLAVGCLLSIAPGQWLETTIMLPDSLCGLRHPRCLTYNSVNNTICVGGDDGECVLAIDGATNQKIARIPTGSYGIALCYNPTNNKVYCANSWSDDVTVIDGASNSVITTVAAGDYPCALCYNPQNNKVYGANEYSDNVTVIDGATNQVLRTIGVGDSPLAFCHNPRENRVYVANVYGSSISVLRDSGGGITETMNDERGTMNVGPTIVRGIIRLTIDECRMSNAGLLNAAGRKVMDLKPGANDVSRLAPGVYFVRAVSGKLSAVGCRRVVLGR